MLSASGGGFFLNPLTRDFALDPLEAEHPEPNYRYYYYTTTTTTTSI